LGIAALKDLFHKSTVPRIQCMIQLGTPSLFAVPYSCGTQGHQTSLRNCWCLF